MSTLLATLLAASSSTTPRQLRRSLTPDGYADFRHTEDYRRQLAPDATSRSLGPGYWYGGPWAATSLVTATKA